MAISILKTHLATLPDERDPAKPDARPILWRARLRLVMGLAEYHRKRDFKKTAEPRGKLGKATHGGMKFVVQKHDATRLHYDFRLEVDGVLKSWAVPKGPSYDSKDKRLAAQVEDHPLEYGEFEGIIPAGEYGGGTVMIWDRGTWEPIGDAAAGIAAGKIHFTLRGEKLKGEWALVRMHGRFGDGGKNWLLFKVDDRFANASARITETKTKSVKTRRTLEQIAEQRDAVWHSSHARKNEPADESATKSTKKSRTQASSMPTKIAPQLAVLSERPPVGEGWLHEIKFDGYRILAFISGGRVQLITRNGNDYTGKFSAIVKALIKLKVDNAIVDGELCAIDERGQTDFHALQSFVKNGAQASLAYYAFDLLFQDGTDLRDQPLIDRKNALAALLKRSRLGRSVQYSEHVAGEGGRVVEEACHLRLEGIISKRADSKYVPRRDPTWLKSKCQQRQEFIVLGWTDPQGGRSGLGALLVGYYDGDALHYAGRVGTGFDDKLLKSLRATLGHLSRETSPVTGPVPARERREAHWVEPKLVCEVHFTGWTPDKVLRHAVFIALRGDKPADEVVREKPIDPDRLRASNGKSARVKKAPDATMDYAGILTHPDKELYPNEHITKRQVADYYSAVASWMLPHVADRPLTLIRCPAGQTAKCFFQRNYTEGLPKSIGKTHVSVGPAKGFHVTIQDAAGLMGLVQIGTLEVHTWQCRKQDIDHPDQLIFDLDPGPDVAWKQVIRAAQTLRARLAELKLKPLVKTSGGKGLHLVLPIVPNVAWGPAEGFCEEIAKALAAEDDRFVANMRKDLRGGKVYIDYHRNGVGATAVAPYSTRARSGAPVSMPISWDEIGRLKSGAQFTVETAPRYLQQRKTDPWADFENHRVDLRKLVGD